MMAKGSKMIAMRITVDRRVERFSVGKATTCSSDGARRHAEFGRGVTYTALDMIYNDFWQTNRNPYALDIVANLIWHGCNRELPSDPMKVHLLRRRLQTFAQEKSFIVSVFDFVERFGANTGELYERLSPIQERKDRAADLYMAGEFDLACEMMEALDEELSNLGDNAMRLKDSALRWVYAVEWVAVLATSLLFGSVVWTLMIKRRLYREVESTRAERGAVVRKTLGNRAWED